MTVCLYIYSCRLAFAFCSLALDNLACVLNLEWSFVDIEILVCKNTLSSIWMTAVLQYAFSRDEERLSRSTSIDLKVSFPPRQYSVKIQSHIAAPELMCDAPCPIYPRIFRICPSVQSTTFLSILCHPSTSFCHPSPSFCHPF